MHDDVYCLVPAAGRGARIGGELPKQFHVVAGRPLLAWTLDQLLDSGLTDITVALPPDHLASGPSLCRRPGVRFVAGGATRQASVALCLRSSPAGDGDLVLVHDGARPLFSSEDLAATVAAARRADGAILGRPLADTLKRLEGRSVQETVDRRGLFRAETPQVFRRAVLEMALARAEAEAFEGSDESSLVERLEGTRVVAVQAMGGNPKITFAGDLARAELALAARAAGQERRWS